MRPSPEILEIASRLLQHLGGLDAPVPRSCASAFPAPKELTPLCCSSERPKKPTIPSIWCSVCALAEGSSPYQQPDCALNSRERFSRGLLRAVGDAPAVFVVAGYPIEEPTATETPVRA